MPHLDVSSVLTDPDFASLFSVVRGRQTVGDNGITTVNNFTYRDIVGVITASSPDDLEFGSDEQHQRKTISVVTKFRLNGVAETNATDFQPDIVLWHGSAFKVVAVMDFSGFGAGFIEATAESTIYVDPPPQTAR